MTIASLEDLAVLVETTDVECKAAQGKSGNGEIPDSIWETYSAMANTNGGQEKSSEKSSEKIIALMRKTKDISAAEIAQSLAITPRAVEKQIEKLKAQGKIQRIGPDKGGHWEVLEKT